MKKKFSKVVFREYHFYVTDVDIVWLCKAISDWLIDCEWWTKKNCSIFFVGSNGLVYRLKKKPSNALSIMQITERITNVSLVLLKSWHTVSKSSQKALKVFESNLEIVQAIEKRFDSEWNIGMIFRSHSPLDSIQWNVSGIVHKRRPFLIWGLENE